MKTFSFLVATLAAISTAMAQSPAFTYQGRLDENAAPASGSYDLRFTLLDAQSGGAQISHEVLHPAVSIADGLFSVVLDFGASSFDGAPRWLEIAVRPAGSSSFATLSPRQPVHSVPHALHAARATTLSGPLPAASLLGTTDNQALNFQVNSLRAFRLEPNPQGAPNVIGGSPVNHVAGGIVGATIGGGGALNFDGGAQTNQVHSHFGTVSGGRNNSIRANSEYSVISGGRDNFVGTSAYYSSIGGGWNNWIQNDSFTSTIGGGRENIIQSSAMDSTIGGGVFNVIHTGAAYSTIAGGWANTIEPNSNESTVAGGRNNVIGNNAFKSTIGGGNFNRIANGGRYSVIAGGDNNRVETDASWASVGGGNMNRANGSYATVPGGAGNTAAGRYSLAAGRNARANHEGSFVWGDGADSAIESSAANSFTARAAGGFRLFSNSDASAGVSLASNGTSWNTICDRDLKVGFTPVNSMEILETLARVPVGQWHYRWESGGAPHLGPLAQDFKAAFFPGRDDRNITTLEFDGVALAAIQGLNQKLEAELHEKEAQIQILRERLASLEAFESRLAELEKRLAAHHAE